MNNDIMKRPHFTRACWPFTCSDCLEEMPAESLMMVVDKTPLNKLGRSTLCETCGKKLLETT